MRQPLDGSFLQALNALNAQPHGVEQEVIKVLPSGEVERSGPCGGTRWRERRRDETFEAERPEETAGVMRELQKQDPHPAALIKFYRRMDPILTNLHHCGILGRALRSFITATKQRNGSDVPYIHPWPLAFGNEQKKVNWHRDHPDIEAYADTFSTCFKGSVAVDGKVPSMRMVLCINPPFNWVKTPTWSSEGWHAQAGLVMKLKEGRGFAVVLYDPEPKMKPQDARYAKKNEALSTIQIEFLKAVKTCGSVKRVYLCNVQDDFSKEPGEDATQVGKFLRDRCMVNVLAFLWRQAIRPDERFDPDEAGKGRWLGCVLLERVKA